MDLRFCELYACCLYPHMRSNPMFATLLEEIGKDPSQVVDSLEKEVAKSHPGGELPVVEARSYFLGFLSGLALASFSEDREMVIQFREKVRTLPLVEAEDREFYRNLTEYISVAYLT